MVNGSRSLRSRRLVRNAPRASKDHHQVHEDNDSVGQLGESRSTAVTVLSMTSVQASTASTARPTGPTTTAKPSVAARTVDLGSPPRVVRFGDLDYQVEFEPRSAESASPPLRDGGTSRDTTVA
jgi:hypothetical protein